MPYMLKNDQDFYQVILKKGYICMI